MTVLFTASSALAPGVHRMTLADLRRSVLVVGPTPAVRGWDARWRLHLVDQLAVLCEDLWRHGISQVVIDGSFCSDKPHPGDIDGYFVTDFLAWRGGLADQLRATRSVWTWSASEMRPDTTGKPKPLMWHQHRVELFPVFEPPFLLVDEGHSARDHRRILSQGARRFGARRGSSPAGPRGRERAR